MNYINLRRKSNEIFLDTGNIEEIKRIERLGLVDGVTTNPSLIAKEGRVFKEVIQEICSIVEGPVSAEVIGLKAEDMLKEAYDIAKWAPNVVIKLPMTEDGLYACNELTKNGIKTNVTLIFRGSRFDGSQSWRYFYQPIRRTSG